MILGAGGSFGCFELLSTIYRSVCSFIQGLWGIFLEQIFFMILMIYIWLIYKNNSSAVKSTNVQKPSDAYCAPGVKLKRRLTWSLDCGRGCLLLYLVSYVLFHSAVSANRQLCNNYHLPATHHVVTSFFGNLGSTVCYTVGGSILFLHSRRSTIIFVCV